MNIENLKKQFQERDRAVRVLSEDGMFRCVAIKSTGIAKSAQAKHELPLVPAFYLAKLLTASSLLSAFLKGEERVSITLESSGLIKKIFAESIQVGETKGFVVFAPELATIEDVSKNNIIGAGLLKVTRILYNRTEPISGVVSLAQGDISTDLAYYFTQSEQIPTAVILDVAFDDNGQITQSGGLFIQAMPGANTDTLTRIVENLYNLPPITKYFDEGLQPEEVIRKVVDFKFEIVKKVPVDFFCRCSKETFISHITSFGAEEVESMRNLNHNEVICIYCNNKYIIEESDFESILTQIQASKN